MKLKNPLLVVSDLEASKRFYREVLGLRVILDFGANVTLTGGLCLQTQESWMGFLSKAAEDISFGGNDAELYFEEEKFRKLFDRAGSAGRNPLRSPSKGAQLGTKGGSFI